MRAAGARTSVATLVLLGASACAGDTGDRSAEPSTSPSPSRSAAPSAASAGAASPGPSASPAERGWDPAAAFLSPEAATRAEQPGWGVDEAYEPEAGPVLDPCGDGGFALAEQIAASDERALESPREVGGSRLVQEVFRYRSAGAAADALAAYGEEVERCPEVQPADVPEGYTTRWSVVEQTETDGVRRLLVRRQPCMPGGACTEHFRSYQFVAQADDGLTAVDYGIGEDGDPEEWARALLDAAVAQLAVAAQDG